MPRLVRDIRPQDRLQEAPDGYTVWAQGMHNMQPGVKVEAHPAGGTGELAGLPLQVGWLGRPRNAPAGHRARRGQGRVSR